MLIIFNIINPFITIAVFASKWLATVETRNPGRRACILGLASVGTVGHCPVLYWGHGFYSWMYSSKSDDNWSY